MMQTVVSIIRLPFTLFGFVWLIAWLPVWIGLQVVGYILGWLLLPFHWVWVLGDVFNKTAAELEQERLKVLNEMLHKLKTWKLDLFERGFRAVARWGVGE